jgi:hypothetical protein
VDAAWLGEQALNSRGELALRGMAAELRAAGRAPLAPAFSVGYAPKRALDLGALNCELERLVGTVGARLRFPANPFDIAFEPSAVLAIERVRGAGLARPETGSAVNFGVRALLLASFARSRVAPVLAVGATLIPAPAAIRMLPQGEIGHLPILWLGVSLGARISL